MRHPTGGRVGWTLCSQREKYPESSSIASTEKVSWKTVKPLPRMPCPRACRVVCSQDLLPPLKAGTFVRSPRPIGHDASTTPISVTAQSGSYLQHYFEEIQDLTTPLRRAGVVERTGQTWDNRWRSSLVSRSSSRSGPLLTDGRPLWLNSSATHQMSVV